MDLTGAIICYSICALTVISMALHQPCPTQMAYGAKNYIAILTRAAHGMTY